MQLSKPLVWNDVKYHLANLKALQTKYLQTGLQLISTIIICKQGVNYRIKVSKDLTKVLQDFCSRRSVSSSKIFINYWSCQTKTTTKKLTNLIRLFKPNAKRVIMNPKWLMFRTTVDYFQASRLVYESDLSNLDYVNLQI